MQVYQRNTNNLDASFVRVDDLVKLGVAVRNGSRLTTVFPDLSGATTVAQLPQASAIGAGARRFVTDATATTFLSTVVGGAQIGAGSFGWHELAYWVIAIRSLER